MLQRTCANCGVTTVEDEERWVKELAYRAAFDRTNEDPGVARYVTNCDRVQDLLAEGDYPEAIIMAAILARKLADNEGLTLDKA